MSRVAYVAQPIDFISGSMYNEVHMVVHEMTKLGWLVYSPAMAWSLDKEAKPGPEIEQINRWALMDADLVVAFLPQDVHSHGVPMEIEAACSRGIRTLVYTEKVGWALAGVDAEVFIDLPQLIHAIPNPVRDSGLQSADGLRFNVGVGGRLPTRTHEGDVGYDLYSSQEVVIYPGEFADIPTNVRVALPAGYWANIVGRSSTWRKWHLNAVPGVIDTGYRGELFSAVQNPGRERIVVPAGSRLTQMILHHNLASVFDPEQVTDFQFECLPGDGRGSAGFGSTGT